MKFLSLSAYAKTHGATRQAAAKWRDNGALVLEGKLVDVKKSDARMRAAGLGRFKSSGEGGQPPPATKARNRREVARKVPRRKTEIDDDEDDEDDLPSDEELKDFVENLLQGRFLSKVGAAAVKENSLALKHWLAGLKAANAVVDVEVAEAIFFESARAERDAWMSFPARVGPLLAADLDVDTESVVEALTIHVQKQLEHLGEPEVDFTADKQ